MSEACDKKGEELARILKSLVATPLSSALLKEAAAEIDKHGLFTVLLLFVRRNQSADNSRVRRCAIIGYSLVRQMCEQAYGAAESLACEPDEDASPVDVVLARAMLHVMSECKKLPSQDPLFVERSPHD